METQMETNPVAVGSLGHLLLSAFTNAIFEITDPIVEHYRSDIGHDIATIARELDTGVVSSYAYSVRESGTYMFPMPLTGGARDVLVGLRRTTNSKFYLLQPEIINLDVTKVHHREFTAQELEELLG